MMFEKDSFESFSTLDWCYSYRRKYVILVFYYSLVQVIVCRRMSKKWSKTLNTGALYFLNLAFPIEIVLKIVVLLWQDRKIKPAILRIYIRNCLLLSWHGNWKSTNSNFDKCFFPFVSLLFFSSLSFCNHFTEFCSYSIEKNNNRCCYTQMLNCLFLSSSLFIINLRINSTFSIQNLSTARWRYLMFTILGIIYMEDLTRIPREPKLWTILSSELWWYECHNSLTFGLSSALFLFENSG